MTTNNKQHDGTIDSLTQNYFEKITDDLSLVIYTILSNQMTQLKKLHLVLSGELELLNLYNGKWVEHLAYDP